MNNGKRPTYRDGYLKQLMHRCYGWAIAAFGWDVASDKAQRVHRFIEEALELAQALDMPKEDAVMLVDYVYGRPKGEPMQELGGTLTTLCSLSGVHKLDMEDAAEQCLEDVWNRIDQIREKQKRKPPSSPLPGTTAPSEPTSSSSSSLS